MRLWSLHRRGRVYYAQIRNQETGRLMSARSTGKTSHDEALLVVSRWLTEGIPTGRAGATRPAAEVFAVEAVLATLRRAELTKDDADRIIELLRDRGLADGVIAAGAPEGELLPEFLVRFWTYEESPYVREKLAHGHRMGRRHCYESLNRARRYWAPAFEGRRIGEVSRLDLKRFSLELAEGALAPGSVNKIMFAGTTALRWAHENGLIPADPSAGLPLFSGPAARRGVLEPEEVSRLFSAEWPDRRAWVGNVVAATTGLRAGEILALRAGDIGPDCLYVRHSWSERDGLKAPKTGRERVVPLLPKAREALLELLRGGPYGADPEVFVFASSSPERPMAERVLLRGLQGALAAIGIGDADRRRRNLVFHGWRHFYAARMADRLDARTVMLATGHRGSAIFEHYADHALEEDLAEVRAAAQDAFANVIPFPVRAAV